MQLPYSLYTLAVTNEQDLNGRYIMHRTPHYHILTLNLLAAISLPSPFRPCHFESLGTRLTLTVHVLDLHPLERQRLARRLRVRIWQPGG